MFYIAKSIGYNKNIYSLNISNNMIGLDGIILLCEKFKNLNNLSKIIINGIN